MYDYDLIYSPTLFSSPIENTSANIDGNERELISEAYTTFNGQTHTFDSLEGESSYCCRFSYTRHASSQTFSSLFLFNTHNMNIQFQLHENDFNLLHTTRSMKIDILISKMFINYFLLLFGILNNNEEKNRF